MFASLRLFWRRMDKLKVPYLTAYLFSTLVIVFAVYAPKVIGAIIDMFISENRVKDPKESVDEFILWLLLYLSMFVAKGLCNYIKTMLLERGSQKILYNVRNELYDKIQNLDMSFFSKNTTGDLISRLTGDLDLIRHMFSWIIYNAFECVIMFVMSFIVLIEINYKLTLILLVFTPLIVVINRKMSKALRPEHQKNREQYTVLSTLAKENITGNRVVKAFVREEYEKERMTVENRKMVERSKYTHRKWLKYNIPYNIINSLLGILGLFGGAIFCIIDPDFTVGDLTVFTGLTWALNVPMLLSGTIINDIQRYHASSEKIISLLNIAPIVRDAPDAFPLDEKIETIEFKNVTLSIDSMKILDNVSFRINAGETVGIMGPTGSGKSMLVGMLARFYDPTDGEILINGKDIRSFTLNSLRKKFAYSHQDVFLFSNSIEGNIAYADPDMPSERVYECARIADADTFIRRETIDGYDTIIGERGIGLSGGQKQRIALARALAADGEVVILDDTTSAVDLETEKKIQDALSEIKGMTKIIIAQRITSVYRSDKILILEKGKLTAMGTHKELKNAGGYYARVFGIQHGSGKEAAC